MVNSIDKTSMGSLHICLATLYNNLLPDQRGGRQLNEEEVDIGVDRNFNWLLTTCYGAIS